MTYSSTGPGGEDALSGSFDDLADALEAIAEELADRAIEVLRDALESGRGEAGGGRPAEERTLTQARRAVEKAVHLLRGSGR